MEESTEIKMTNRDRVLAYFQTHRRSVGRFAVGFASKVPLEELRGILDDLVKEGLLEKTTIQTLKDEGLIEGDWIAPLVVFRPAKKG